LIIPYTFIPLIELSKPSPFTGYVLETPANCKTGTRDVRALRENGVGENIY